MTTLVVAHNDDLHTKAVARCFKEMGHEYWVLDTGLFPTEVSVDLRFTACGHCDFNLRAGDTSYPLANFGSGWWRRPQQPRMSESLTDTVNQMFAANECAEAINGLWHTADMFWLNKPAADHVAHRKIKQLRVAQRCGLRVPKTTITNDPNVAKVFIDNLGYRNIIYKAFSALENAWRETRLLKAEELEMLDSVQYAPVIFQEYVPAQYDLRITIVGNEIFPAAIYSGESDYPVDFRMDMGKSRIAPVELPRPLRERLLRFMSEMDLTYGALDLRLRPDGEYVFLEINPAGQWLFVEEKTQQPIAQAVANLLAREDRSRQHASKRAARQSQGCGCGNAA